MDKKAVIISFIVGMILGAGLMYVLVTEGVVPLYKGGKIDNPPLYVDMLETAKEEVK